jgi:alanine racemase
MKTLRRTWAEISLDNLQHNYAAIKAHLPKNTKILGVMKADAYGHGAVPVSGRLAELGCAYLAVSNLEEAVQIRRGGVRTPILILGYTPADYADTMVFMDFTQEVHSLEYAMQLEEKLAGTNYRLNVHVKFDTGMGRIGFLPRADGFAGEMAKLSQLGHLHFEGAFMHFCAADSKDPADADFTKQQYALFEEALQVLEEGGIRPEIRHCANSGATLLYPEYAMDMVRPGIALYGCAPSRDCEGILDLKPVMSLHTTLAQIRTLPKGTPISYGRTFVTERELRVGVLPIGYADGLPRRLSGKADFYYRGKRLPILGRICMDMCMVDLTEAPDAKVGDVLTLFGTAPDGAVVPVERLADAADTIQYELLSQVSKRIARRYYLDGHETEILQYIV